MVENITQIREITVKYKKSKKALFPVKEAAHVAKFARSVLPDNSREHMIALYLDGAHQVIAYSLISTGTANSTNLHPREVLQRAILVGSIALCLVHNHPSGNLDASPEDIKATRVIQDACKLIGMRLLDHVIVSDYGHNSLNEAGII